MWGEELRKLLESWLWCLLNWLHFSKSILFQLCPQVRKPDHNYCTKLDSRNLLALALLYLGNGSQEQNFFGGSAGNYEHSGILQGET